MVSLFHGSALCDVDGEGIVSLPDFVADVLGPEGSAPDLLVTKHDADPCLVGYDRSHLSELGQRAERRRLADEAAGRDARTHYHRMRRTFGVVERLPRCGTKLRIPPAMRHLGRIDRLALFVGTGESFEIWNPEFAVESGDEQFRELAAYRLQARGTGSTSARGH